MLFSMWLHCHYLLVVIGGQSMVVTASDVELSEEVRKYPALFDKSSPDYHNNTIVENCWNRVQRQLGFENWKEAKEEFRKLRKRFKKQRLKTENANMSGTSTAEKVLACGGAEEMSGWEFLSWLQPFITTRQTKSNSSFQTSSSFCGPGPGHKPETNIYN